MVCGVAGVYDVGGDGGVVSGVGGGVAAVCEIVGVCRDGFVCGGL